MDLAAPIHSRVMLGSLTTLSAVLLLALGSSVAARSAAPMLSAAAPDSAVSKKEARAAYGTLPLAFVPNAGQTDARVRYSAQAGGASFYFTQKEAVFSFARKEKGLALRLGFLGANPEVAIGARERGNGRVNYLLGGDPAKWRTNLPTYGEVVYQDLWPGIDMVFRGAKGQLKYEFLVAPGARVSDIRLAYRGAGGLSLGRSGALRIQTPLGVLTDTAPHSYQIAAGKRVPVASRYALHGRRGYGFALGAGYDPTRLLVIDPGLLYSTYLGGGGTDQAFFRMDVDATGSAYVTGRTNSTPPTPFPTTPGTFDTSYNGGEFDAFVTKLDPTGSTPVYSTYLGGNDHDQGFAVTVDAAGNAHVTGFTESTNFPTTPGAFDRMRSGFSSDAFVAKLNPTGSALVYSTYLGGGSSEQGLGIAVGVTGSAYVTGGTASTAPTPFPTTPGAFDTTYNGDLDVFFTKLNPAGSALDYSTYLGGTVFDGGRGISVDAAGNAYLTGQTAWVNTTQTPYPTTAGAFDQTFNGGVTDAFASKLNPNLVGPASLVYSTFLGGSGFDEGWGIVVDAIAGSAYVTGTTPSTDFPTTPLAFDTTHNGVDDAFVTKLNPTGSALDYSTYLGGSSNDEGFGIALDGLRNAYVTGGTFSSAFPTTGGAFDETYNGGGDAFLTRLVPTGSALLYSTYLGGGNNDSGRGIAVDAAASAYVSGYTGSSTPTPFPTSAGAFDTSYNGGQFDAFVAKLDAAGAPATLVLDPPAATNTVGTSHTVTATVTDANGDPVEEIVVRFTVTGSVNTTGECTTDANGDCDFTYQGPPLPGDDAITAYADSDDDTTQDPGEPTGAATKAWVLPPSTEFCEVTITQGGWIIAMNGDRATFNGNARVEADGTVHGEEKYRDHGPAQPRHVQSIELTAVTCSEDLTEATIFGRATVDGAGDFMFRIDVTDQGQDDTYGLTMSDGYASGQQPLRGGNVKIHKN